MKTSHKHTIQLSSIELSQIQNIIRRGKHNTRIITRARILLLSHKGGGKDAIATAIGVNRSTVQDVRDRFRSGGLERALYDAPRPGQPVKITDESEAYLVALATSSPPKGNEKWTLELLRKRMIADGKVQKEISVVALWKRLDQRGIKPWREKNVVHSDHYAIVH